MVPSKETHKIAKGAKIFLSSVPLLAGDEELLFRQATPEQLQSFAEAGHLERKTSTRRRKADAE